MERLSRSCCLLILMLSTVLWMAACGGGGSGPKSITLVDPSPSYTGAKNAAALSAANAETIATDAFIGGRVASAIGTPKTVAKTVTVRQRKVQQVADVLNRSLSRMELPRLARERAAARHIDAAAKRASKVETFEVYGDQGGRATYSLDVNQADGSFAGTVTYHEFAADGMTLSGSTDVLGAFDSNNQWFTRLTLSFRTLTLTTAGDSFTLTGSLSWGYTPSAASDSLTVNMVLGDGTKTYWFNNYQLVNVYGSNSVNQTLSGRYYDADSGYVDVSTPTPLVAYYGNSWPSAGEVRFTGDAGGWVDIGFQRQSYTVRVDGDNDDNVDWHADRATDNPPPANSGPQASAGADRSVPQGALVVLDGGGSSDPDGDALSYYWSVDTCPAGGYPTLSGYNTASPSFIPEVPGTYVVRLSVNDGRYATSSDTVTIVVSAVQPSNPDLLQKQWQYGVFGTDIGKAGLLGTDLDADGTPEIIASAFGGSGTIWYVLKRTAEGDYEQLWRSKFYAAGVVKLLLAELTGDGRDDVVVAQPGGTIEIYSGPSLQLAGTVNAASGLTAMAVADLEGDGAKEIVVSDGAGIYVYSAQGGALKWSSATGGGASLAVGNVDGDAALEIVTTTYGGQGYVVDGIARSISWQYYNGFGSKVELGDVDGDGMQEIVGSGSWGKITVFDADRKTPVWEIVTAQDIGSHVVTDVDGDGVPEIVYGDGQWGKLHAIDARTRQEKWAVDNPEHGVSGIALVDVDRDGTRELLWGAGGSSSGADYLFIVNPQTGTEKWRSVHVDGPLSPVAVGDVDDDGEDEVLMVSFESESGYEEGVIHIFNARTHALEFRGRLGIMDWMGVRSVEMGDVDGDGRTEFVVTTGNIYDGVIRVYDGASRTLKKQSAGYSGSYLSALALGDVDGDGRMEIVVGQGREHSGATGSYILVLDGQTLEEKWRSVDTGGSWEGIYDFALADVDGDGHKDIVATISGSRLMVYDGVNHDLKLLLPHASRAVVVADVDGAGGLELVVGRTDGRIDVFDGSTFALKTTVSSYRNASVDAIRILDLDGNGVAEWLVASGGMLSVIDGSGLVWRSGELSSNLGWYNHLAVKDCDGDGRKEIYVGSQDSLYQFE